MFRQGDLAQELFRTYQGSDLRRDNVTMFAADRDPPIAQQGT